MEKMQAVSEIKEKYTTVIGLEIHCQLKTKTKIFSADRNAYGEEPNTNISAITLGHPGTMPKLNEKVIELAVRMGLACGSKITRHNIFDRKNYFYPDLPKGYQLTQDKTPICRGGEVCVKVNGDVRCIGIEKIHLEEDAGKSMHLEDSDDTAVDYNRAGVPLIEIVTRPDMRSPEEASALLGKIRKMVRYLEISDGDMEKGSLRCDANVSIMLSEAREFGQKVEIKNMNSMRHVQRAVTYEIERQIREVENGNKIRSETRTFNAEDGTTSGMREKEGLKDYRYFPEPDLSPFVITDEWLGKIRSNLPSLPEELFKEFTETFKIPEYNAEVLTESKSIAIYFQSLCEHTSNYKAASNWMMGPVKSYLNENNKEISEFPLKPEKMADLIALVDAGEISFSMASQKIYPHLLNNPERNPRQAAEMLNLIQESGTDTIKLIVEEVIATLPEKVSAYRKGKKGLLKFFMGEVMKRSKGKANPKIANQLLKKCLEGHN